VKVADFGISKVKDGSTGTTPGTLKGKIIYMAPEQVDGALGPVDVLSDTFATGLLLHECLTGAAVFRRPSEAAAMHAVLHAPIPGLRALRPDVPSELDRIVAKATQRDRALRYQTCADLQKDLEDLARTQGLPATSTHLAVWLTEIAEVATSLGAAPRPGMTPSGTRTGLQAPWINEEPTGEDAPTVAAKIDAGLEKAKAEE
jgi:eukaryotic-like serine/threonine-protein kinase